MMTDFIENKQIEIDEIIKNYMCFNIYINDIGENIKKMSKLHSSMLEKATVKNSFDKYGFFVDDIFFKKNILELEYDHLQTIRNLCLKKLYANLFNLYLKISKILFSLDCEYTKVNEGETYIVKYVKNTSIKVYNMNQNITYKLDDVELIYRNIVNNINSIHRYENIINNNLRSLDFSDGYSAKTITVGLNSEKIFIKNQVDTFLNILSIIIDNNLKLSKRYVAYGKILTEETIEENDHSLNPQLIDNSKNNSSIMSPKHNIQSKINFDKQPSLNIRQINKINKTTLERNNSSTSMKNIYDEHEEKHNQEISNSNYDSDNELK
jgi:hypothetical protein